MAFYDLPLDQLRAYTPELEEPSDFDAFWAETLNSKVRRTAKPSFEKISIGLKAIEAYDVTFAGYGGHGIKGWFLIPRGASGKLPCVVEYIGYGGGRGSPLNYLTWAAAGYAHFVMDTRGQGSVWMPGDTPDPEPEGANPFYPGFMTRGILDKNSYYYRRVFTDAVCAIKAAMANRHVDGDRIAVTGTSQGGGVTLAAAGLAPDVKIAMPDVPYLCRYRRATQLVDTMPYGEITAYLKVHRDHVEKVFDTLNYFDGASFARRASAKALFSVGLMDTICPPSTVYAAYNHYAGPKDIIAYEYNNHEGGQTFFVQERINFLQKELPAQ